MAWFKRDGTKDIIRINNNDTSTVRKFKGVYAAWMHENYLDVSKVNGIYYRSFALLIAENMLNFDKNITNERYELYGDVADVLSDQLEKDFITIDTFPKWDSDEYQKRLDVVQDQIMDLRNDSTLSVDEKLDCLMVAAYELRVDTGEINIRDERKREFFSEYTDRILSRGSDFFSYNGISGDKDAIIIDEGALYDDNPCEIVEYRDLGSITDGENRMLEKCFEKGYLGDEAYDVNNRYYFPFVQHICVRERYYEDGIYCDFDKIGGNIARGLDSGCLTPYDDTFVVKDYTAYCYLGYKDFVKDRAYKIAKNESEFNEMVDCMDSFSISELMRGTAKYNYDEGDMLYESMLRKTCTLCQSGVDTGNLIFSPGTDNIKIVDDIMVKLAGYVSLDNGPDHLYVDDKNKLCTSEGNWDFIKYFTKTQDGKERVEKFNKEYGDEWVNRQLKALSEKDNPMKDIDDYIRGLDDSDKETVKNFED